MWPEGQPSDHFGMGKLSQAGSPRDHYSLSFSEVTTGIAEVLDPKGLRKGMNRQDT
jgi:hypothetical protein